MSSQLFPQVPRSSIAQLQERYDALLFDAFGVLLDNAGTLMRAEAMIARLNAERASYFIVSNASRLTLPRTAASYRKIGLEIPPERIVTSGSLLATWVKAHGLCGVRCLLLGPDSCRELLSDCELEIVKPPVTAGVKLIVIGNQSGFEILEGLDTAVSCIFQGVEADSPPALVVPNPDLIYPAQDGRFGLTAGALATVIEAACDARYPNLKLRFTRLGKPHAPIFAEAERLIGSRRLVMIGDQLSTDVAGAKAYGLDAALVSWGVATAKGQGESPWVPDYILEHLA